MPPDMLFDYFGVRLNSPKAAGKLIKLNVHFTDLGKQYALVVENGVLTYHTKFVDNPDAELTLTKDTLDRIQLKQVTVDDAVASDALHIDGKKEAFTEFLSLLDTFPFWFNIVTP
jgi:alkyl sulfatase BDS1-like metallo-beta-lactamase superfamily hydrolase